MEIIFYDVKTRKKVGVPQEQVKKTKFVRKTKEGKEQVRYALRAQYNGTTVTKFISKVDFDKLNVPEE
jgi:hypothetical protein